MVHKVRVSSYIFQRSNGVFYFRMLTPSNLKLKSKSPIKKEIRKSLRTKSKSVAIFRSKTIWLWINKNMHTINDSKDIENFIEDFLNSEEGEIQFKEYYHDATTMEGWKEYLFDQILSVLQAGLISHLESNLSNLEDLYNHSLDIEKKYKASELMKEKTSTLSNFNTNLKVTDASTGDDSNTETAVDKKYTIEFCIQQYTKSYEGTVEERTLQEDTRILHLFKDALNNKLLSALSPVEFTHFEQQLKEYPKNKNKYSHTKALSFHDAIKAAKKHDMDTLSNTTLKRYLRVVSSFMRWCHDNGFINTILGQNLGKRIKKDKSTRKPYTAEDIKNIFVPKHYKKSTKNSPARFWIPLIALFTGARIEELASLKVSDITKKKDVWCFDINAYDDRLKNESSIRLTPIHDSLLQIGILKHLEWVKKNFHSNQYLFPDVVFKKENSRLSSKYSKWWHNYMPKRVDSEKGKVFHSFRHTFTTMLNVEDVEINKQKYILGHAQIDVTSSVYTHEYNLKSIKKELDKVKFNIEISELQKLWLPINKRFLRFYSNSC